MIWNWAPCTMWADIFSKWVDAFKYHWYSLMLLMFSGRIGRTDFPLMAHPPPNWCRYSKKGTQPWAAHSFFRFVAHNMGHNELCQNGKWIVQWPDAACPLRLLLWRLRTNLIDAYRACICLYPNIYMEAFHFFDHGRKQCYTDLFQSNCSPVNPPEWHCSRGQEWREGLWALSASTPYSAFG